MRLTPTQSLILDLLGARRRIGESAFAISSRHLPAVKDLAAAGLVAYHSGIADSSMTVALTDNGLEAALSRSYEPPLAELHRNNGFGRCTECARTHPCQTRLTVMPFERVDQGIPDSSGA